jgi:hypothetical protein
VKQMGNLSQRRSNVTVQVQKGGHNVIVKNFPSLGQGGHVKSLEIRLESK